MPKQSYKKYIPFQSEFSHHLATWANNHRGWSKMKKYNRKYAKKRMYRDLKKQDEIECEQEGY